jgi:hypothetical protein
MRTVPLPLTGVETAYLVVVANGDGTATLYEPGDDLPPDLLPSLRTRSDIVTAIDAHANGLREAATAGITAAEMAGWPIKRAEAIAYQGDQQACPLLSEEAAARGVTLQEIVDLVLANAARYAALEAAIAGVAGRHKDAVRAMTEDAARTYDWSIGWPDL